MNNNSPPRPITRLGFYSGLSEEAIRFYINQNVMPILIGLSDLPLDFQETLTNNSIVEIESKVARSIVTKFECKDHTRYIIVLKSVPLLKEDLDAWCINLDRKANAMDPLHQYRIFSEKDCLHIIVVEMPHG